MTKSISLVLGANRATLSGPKSKQYRIRQNAKAFAKRLRRAGFGVQKWTKIFNKHFAAVAQQMKEENIGDGRIAELFSAVRTLCKTYGNNSISLTNDVFGVLEDGPQDRLAHRYAATGTEISMSEAADT